MNKSGNGRWHRYITLHGELHKKCNGPLHDEEYGAWLPLRSFWIHNRGERKGKPMSRCIACERISRKRDPAISGLVPVDRVWFVFAELEFRIGKAETMRRLGVSGNLYYRLNKRIYKQMYRRTAREAILLLHEVRLEEIARHRKSIKHGAAARGRRERVPVHPHDYNGKNDVDNEYQRRKRKRA